MVTFAERLKEERKRAGLSQEELARKSGCGQSLIGNLESGAQKSTAKLPQIAAALGINALYLAERKGPRTQNDRTAHAVEQSVAKYKDADISALVAAVERLSPEDARALLPVVTRIADSQPRSTARRRGTQLDMNPAAETPDAAHG